MTKYLIIGLGNVGDAYAGTRHNIGFEVVDYLAIQENISWTLDRHAYITSFKMKGKQVIMIKPTTYMNLSGKAVKYWMDKEKIDANNLFVILDDLALPIEKFRIRNSGSDAGHNGLKDIQFVLQTTEYPRLRFGIGNQYPKGMQAEFVLGKWRKEEIPLVLQKIELAATIVRKFVLEGINSAMNYGNQLKPVL